MIRRIVLSGPPPVAEASGAMTAPAAARNLDAILDVLLPHLPDCGEVMEIASGTGQHIAALAAHRPDLAFHPSDPDPKRRGAIDARCRTLPNVRAARDIDASTPGWAREAAANMVLVVNLLHLISDAELAVLLDEAQQALAPGGLLAIYGPFLRDGIATSAGDRAFDAQLRSQDPHIGLKDAGVVVTVLAALSLRVEIVDMPANNLMLLARAPLVPGLL